MIDKLLLMTEDLLLESINIAINQLNWSSGVDELDTSQLRGLNLTRKLENSSFHSLSNESIS